MIEQKNQERIAIIQQRLQELKPTMLEIDDESHLHAGHPGARSGAGHFALRIASEAFDDKSPIQRHRMVLNLLADLIPHEIHAISIKTHNN